MNVLIVSLHSNFLADGIKTLTLNGFVPQYHNTVEDACAASQTLAPFLVILDVNSTSGDPASNCQALCDASRAPIVVVSWEALSETEAAACFDAGAGARLLRSVSPLLLLSWAQALTRRF